MFGCVLGSFNSIKVRLKLFNALGYGVDSLFQFHKGAIETARRGSVRPLFPHFQFHKGAIETEHLREAGLAFESFNSIKVGQRIFPVGNTVC